jgi:MoaA/NifB/PqqE/SkfB family radical SAM enzyme
MDFEELQSRLGLDDDAWGVVLGFHSFGEEPLDRLAHLCRVEDATLARVLPGLVARGIVRSRPADGATRYALAPSTEWLPPATGGDVEEYEAEAATLKRLRDLRGLPSIVVISSRELRDRSRLAPELVRHFGDLFPNVDLRLGTRCNLNCVYCLLGHEDRYLRPAAEVAADMAFARAQNLEKVALTGGEPSIHPDVLRLVSTARRLGFRFVMLITNGITLSYQGHLERFVRAGVNLVGVSFDTPDRDTAEALWQGPVYDRVVAGLRAAAAHPGVVTRSIAVITKRNASQLPDLARFFVDVAAGSSGPFMPNLDFVMPEENAWLHRAELVPRLSDVAGQVREALDIAHRAGLPMTFRGIPFCLLPGLERYGMDLYMTIFQLVRTPGGVVFDRTAMDVLRTKARGCRRCRHFRECAGVSRSYAALYGLDELRPVEANP